MTSDMDDLRERLQDAADTLLRLAGLNERGRDRLLAKRSGVLLALDYTRAYKDSEVRP